MSTLSKQFSKLTWIAALIDKTKSIIQILQRNHYHCATRILRYSSACDFVVELSLRFVCFAHLQSVPAIYSFFMEVESGVCQH